MEVLIRDKWVREINSGYSFGDIALLYNSTRTATIRSLTECELYGINRDKYKEFVTDI